MEPTNHELLIGVAAADSNAWEALVERYSEVVWRVSGTYGLNSAVRQDVSQTVWLKLHSHAGRIRQPERLVGWLAQVTRNECLNVLRRQSHIASLDDDYELASDEENLTIDLEREDASQALAIAFSQLGHACRELLTLCMVDPPLSYDEIAEQLGIPRGSIGPTRRRCLDKLRRMPVLAAFDPKEATP